MPEVLSECPQLSIVGFKSNKIVHFSETALPKMVRWLILTDNLIQRLPDSIGELSVLQKLALAGNRIAKLPQAMKECKNLELIRISANRLSELPKWLVTLPRLSWLAYSGNPCSHVSDYVHRPLSSFPWHNLSFGKVLGEGASGTIYQGSSAEHDEIAIKVFKGEMTSDGLPEDEMKACITAGEHKNLIKVLGRFHHKEKMREGLLLSLIPPSYQNLGSPPSLDSCTRDTYEEGRQFSLAHIMNVLRGIASAASHLHSRGLMHGDLYAHNILFDERGHCFLGDFGAASFYDPANKRVSQALERLEVRAFGCLLDDLLTRCNEGDAKRDKGTISVLKKLRLRCLDDKPLQRPFFEEINSILNSADKEHKLIICT